MYHYQSISLFAIAFVTAFAVAEDSVTFVAKPGTLHFNSDNEKITSVQLTNVILTSMGFTVDLRNGGWDGAYISSPFNPPRVVVGLRVRDSSTFETLLGRQIPLIENLKWDELFSILVERGEKRLDNLRSDYFFVNEENAVAQSVLVLDKLSKDVVENGTVAPIIYFADMTRAHLVSPEMDESAKKLVESVEALNGIMILVKSSDITSHHSRRTRQAPPPAPKNPMNLAEDVSEDYPVIFNILLFIGISLTLALIAICVAIASMDPGRDSLIYRVTSAQRFKKDN
ncbi:unnamed protein product [Orchesella dallaii]|uniref:Renin receptor-like C-terminal transmembrane spanning segment domain-containing protein n=1 Tax=Orchesella dallaii TaxID=48710 RepID=A0ABP1PU38_9HEXA